MRSNSTEQNRRWRLELASADADGEEQDNLFTAYLELFALQF